MLHTRLASILLYALGTAAWAAEDFTRTRIAGTDYCIPRRNLVEPSEWIAHATRHLPDSGVAFTISAPEFSKSVAYVPSLSARGAALPVTGVVDMASSGMIARPAKDHHWVSYAKGSTAAASTDPATRTLTVYEDSTRAFWVVWRVAEGKPLSSESLPDHAEVVASCRRTLFGNAAGGRARELVGCQRTFAKDGLRISYSFGGENVDRTAAMDKAIARQVATWRCRG